MCVHVQLGASLGSGQVLRAGLWHHFRAPGLAQTQSVLTPCGVIPQTHEDEPLPRTARRAPGRHRRTLPPTRRRAQSADAARRTRVGSRGRAQEQLW